MIERASEFGASAAAPLVTGDSTHMTAGDMLRQAREAHGLHIDMVAAALKVSTRKMEALEADDIDALPDAMFARALAASVCRALRIDPAPVLAKLPGAQPAGLAQADRTMSKTLRSAVPRSGPSSSGSPSRALLVVVVLLLLGAAALFWLPQSVFDQVGTTFSNITAKAGLDGSGSSGAVATEPATRTGPNGTVVEAVVPPTLAVAPSPPPAAPPVQTPPTVVPAPGNTVVFVARKDSWITVNEAGGKSLLRRTVRAGETVGITGTPPLSIVVGQAAGVDVQVRGRPFDLASSVRAGGVARFEIKP